MRQIEKRSAVVIGAAAVLAFAGAAHAVPFNTQLLTNPGFEDPVIAGGGVEEFGPGTGWTEFGGGNFRQTSAAAGVTPNSGNQSLKMFGNPSGDFQTFAANPGETWNGGVWMYNNSVDPILPGQVAAVNIEWLQADLSPSAIIPFISNGTFNAGGAAPIDTWQLQTITGEAPADAAFARLTIITGAFAPEDGPGGGAVWMDDAFFEKIPAPGTAGLLAIGGLAATRRRR
ncbi:MAG: hypothetical protein AAFX05_01030 [Planctomycetota bacterium]